MGVSCSKLFCLFCCPPYLPSIVSKIAFNPPPCTYSVIRDGQFRSKFLILCNGFEIMKEHEKYVNYHVINGGHKKKNKNKKSNNDNDDNNNRISCIYFKTAPWTKNTILFSHGNAVDMGLIAEGLIELGLKLKVNIITYDYSGYGASSSKPSERNLYSNIISVLEYMQANLDIPHRNIILYGQSIGSVPTLFLAAKFRFGVVVLHSPLASGFKFLNCCSCSAGSICRCCDVLDNLKMIKSVRSRILIIHGVDDEVTPVEHSYALLKEIPSDKLLDPLIIDGAGHNNCDLFPVYLQRLQHLIDNELEMFQIQLTDSIYHVK